MKAAKVVTKTEERQFLLYLYDGDNTIARFLLEAWNEEIGAERTLEDIVNFINGEPHAQLNPTS